MVDLPSAVGVRRFVVVGFGVGSSKDKNFGWPNMLLWIPVDKDKIIVRMRKYSNERQTKTKKWGNASLKYNNDDQILFWQTQQ